jgi:hypothetical protein
VKLGVSGGTCYIGGKDQKYILLKIFMRRDYLNIQRHEWEGNTEIDLREMA